MGLIWYGSYFMQCKYNPVLSRPMWRQTMLWKLSLTLRPAGQIRLFPPIELVHYLVPVLTGVVDLSHRTWLENINESTKRGTQNIRCIIFWWCMIIQYNHIIGDRWNEYDYEVTVSVSVHSLAQQDSILQTLHEVFPHPLGSHILNPQPQLLLLLGVVLPCQLSREIGQMSEVTCYIFSFSSQNRSWF